MKTMQTIGPELVEAARSGNQFAITKLYENTYNAVYHAAKALVRDEDAVLDIVQDAYISGLRHLDQLNDPAQFEAWMKRIASNTARNYLKRKKPVLFSELENDEGEMTLDFADERTENLPEAVLDDAETARLINEILDTLPDEQRLIVGMYAYEGMTLREISRTLGLSENTVGSRWRYAKAKIEAKVRELEKKGTKLYSLTPVPFLCWLFKGFEASSMQAPSAAVLKGVQAGLAAAAGSAAASAASAVSGAGATSSAATTAAASAVSGAGATSSTASAAAGTAAKTAARGLFKTLGAKIAAAVTAVAVAGGGIALGTQVFRHEHVWVDATCTEPKICSECGETEGEPLGHTWLAATCDAPSTCSVCGATEGAPLEHIWLEATCTEPRTCSLCGRTEGEALGHTLTPANYQQPETCSVCGETFGDPLMSSFKEHGFTQFMHVGGTYTYKTAQGDGRIFYSNNETKTYGQLTVTDYRIFLSDETHEAREGYEWRVASFHMEFGDSYAKDNGVSASWSVGGNYYENDGLGTTVEHQNDNVRSTTVNYNGEDYECLYYDNIDRNEIADTTWYCDVSIHYLVPSGYDGMVVAFFDPVLIPDGVSFFDMEPALTTGQLLFFRFTDLT